MKNVSGNAGTWMPESTETLQEEQVISIITKSDDLTNIVNNIINIKTELHLLHTNNPKKEYHDAMIDLELILHGITKLN